MHLALDMSKKRIIMILPKRKPKRMIGINKTKDMMQLNFHKNYMLKI
jgi:hypothetical protein